MSDASVVGKAWTKKEVSSRTVEAYNYFCLLLRVVLRNMTTMNLYTIVFIAIYAHRSNLAHGFGAQAYLQENSTPYEQEVEPEQTVAPEQARCDDIKPEITLNFVAMGLQSLGARFIESPYVTGLNVSDNRITIIDHRAFESLPNLEVLDISRNKIDRAGLSSWNNLGQLRILICDNNFGDNYYQLTSNSISLMPNLERLYLRGNSIRRFEVPLTRQLPNLTSLYLSRNNLGASSVSYVEFSTSAEYLPLPSDTLLRLPPTLKRLHLDENSLSDIRWTGPNSVSHLVLDGNRFEYLCYDCRSTGVSLEGLTKLEHLSVSRNVIRDVKLDTFNSTKSLRSLDLSGNRIEFLDRETFSSVPLMENLSISDNPLVHIPYLCLMPSLRTLSLSRNMIEDVHSITFCNSSSLERLSLVGNRIQSIDSGAFANLNSLVYLDLSDNQLSWLPDDWFVSPNNLRVLKINRNRIVDLGELSLRDMHSLVELHLRGNPIEVINTGVFRDTRQNVALFLNSKVEEHVPSSTVESTTYPSYYGRSRQLSTVWNGRWNEY